MTASRSRRRWARVLPALVLGLTGLAARAAAQDPMSKAFDLERRGNYIQAAAIYRSILSDRPGDVSALLGLERALTPMNRLREVLPAVRAGIRANPGAVALYGIAMRVFSSQDMLDSMPQLVDQWSRASPGDATPYREWAASALLHRDRVTARRAYQLGRQRLGRPDALAAEMAQLAVSDQDWPTAAREWVHAVRQLPGYRASATTTLSQAPAAAHPNILQALEKEGGPEAGRIAVDLRARWGDPLGALDALLKALPTVQAHRLDALQGFLELVRTESSPPYLLAQARTLEALADGWPNPSQRARYRLEAARAYVGAGDREAARRMLGQIAQDDSIAPGVAAGAGATLIELLVTEGKADEAARQLEQHRTSLPVEDYLRLRREVAARLAQTGQIPRAEQLLAADSSVESLALQGRFRLYDGDLKGASELMREAGPFAGTRAEATERSGLLALIQPIGPDTVIGLGHAFQALDRGDSLTAAQGFEQVADSLPPDAGRPEVQLFAGRVYAALARDSDAVRVLQRAVVKDSPATAAAALLELGRLYLRQGRRDQAKVALEQMIIDYPASALIPQARRLLDQARNAVPET